MPSYRCRRTDALSTAAASAALRRLVHAVPCGFGSALRRAGGGRGRRVLDDGQALCRRHGQCARARPEDHVGVAAGRSQWGRRARRCRGQGFSRQPALQSMPRFAPRRGTGGNRCPRPTWPSASTSRPAACPRRCSRRASGRAAPCHGSAECTRPPSRLHRPARLMSSRAPHPYPLLFPGRWHVLSGRLQAGVGGNTIACAKRFGSVTAFELDPGRAALLAQNLEVRIVNTAFTACLSALAA